MKHFGLLAIDVSLGERQEIVYLPLPPGEGWGEGAVSRATPRRTPSPPVPLPEGEGRNAGAARFGGLRQSGAEPSRR